MRLSKQLCMRLACEILNVAWQRLPLCKQTTMVVTQSIVNHMIIIHYHRGYLQIYIIQNNFKETNENHQNLLQNNMANFQVRYVCSRSCCLFRTAAVIIVTSRNVIYIFCLLFDDKTF